MQLRKKISSMAEEIMELRIELSKKEEKVFVLEQQLTAIESIREASRGG